MHRQAGTAAFIVWTTLAIAKPAAADVVADWNVCAPAIIATGRATIQFGAGPATQLDLATVHLAMHDAIQAYDHRFEPYAGKINAGGGSAIAAAARSAHTVLATMFPAQLAAIDACYATSMTGVVLTPPDLAASNTVGNMAALNVLMSRDGDGSFPAGPIAPFTGGQNPGQWRLNPGTASMVAPWLGDVRPLAIESVQRCQPDDLPALTSFEYAEAYNEVKAVGSINSTERTPEQGHIARTFSGNFAGQFNRLMRELAAAYIGGTDVASLGDRARLFALANTAAADALICAWNSKKAFNFWRPHQAIRNGGADGNILTDEDTTWTSYMPPPNYPDYTSGANNIGGSMTRALELFFGSDKPFDTPFRIYALGGAVPLLPTDALYREYSKFSDIAKEIIVARIYLGIHFRFADTEARSQGRRAANHTFKNILQPVDKKNK
jgi:VCPO second helical-bundle domain